MLGRVGRRAIYNGQRGGTDVAMFASSHSVKECH